MLPIKEKQKVFPSTKHLIREHQDGKADDNNIDRTNNIDGIVVEEVHTINDWEHADLGDEQRKQKFLRLMGAKKHKTENGTTEKSIHGTTSESSPTSEKKHCRSKIENESISRELEKQFNEGLQSKILHTHHEGLGFHEGESTHDMGDRRVETKFIPAVTKTESPADDLDRLKKSER